MAIFFHGVVVSSTTSFKKIHIFGKKILMSKFKMKNRSQFIGLRPNQIQTFDFQNQSGHPLQYSFLKSTLMKFHINPSIHQVTRTMLGRYHNGKVVNHSPDLGKVVSRPSSDWGSSLLVSSHHIKCKKHENSWDCVSWLLLRHQIS